MGDLFHSKYNSEWDKFATFIQNNNQIHFELIIGNHDILPYQKYKEIGLINHGEALVIDSLIFTHHPLTTHNMQDINKHRPKSKLRLEFRALNHSRHQQTSKAQTDAHY